MQERPFGGNSFKRRKLTVSNVLKIVDANKIIYFEENCPTSVIQENYFSIQINSRKLSGVSII